MRISLLSGKRRCIYAAAMIASAVMAFGTAAATVDATFTGPPGGNWTTPANWSPVGVPNNSGPDVFNVVDPFTGGVTLANATIAINDFTVPSANTLILGAAPLTIHSGTLLVNGTASFGIDQFGPSDSIKSQVLVLCGDPVNTAGNALLSMHNVANYDAPTHTLSGVDWLVGHENTSAAGVNATIQFNGADVHTLINSNISVLEPQAHFTDESGNDALRNLSSLTNTSNLDFLQRGFATSGSLSLSGDSSISAEDSTITINGTLTNFDPATKVLTGGSYNITGNAGTGFLQFNNADIITNRASISIAGAFGGIRDQNGNDGLRHLAANDTGELILTDHNLTTPGDFTNNGLLEVQSQSLATQLKINGTLTNYAAATHTLGVAGDISLDALHGQPATLVFNNADIVTNKAHLALVGPNSAILDQSSNDGLRHFAVNSASASFQIQGRSFTTAGDFTNDGILSVNGSSNLSPVSTFTVAGNLTNYSSTTHTLTGGNYQLSGDGTAPATLKFPSADIFTNAATIDLANNGGIVDQNNLDALRNLSLNSATGGLFLSSHDLTVSGSLSNAGTFSASQSTVSVPSGATFMSSGLTFLDQGTISIPGANGATIQSGTLTGAGTIGGHLHVTGGTVSPGFGADQGTNIITITGNLDGASPARFSFDIGGTTRGDGGADPITFATLLGYSAMDIAGSASLGGELHVNMLNEFVPSASDQFVLLDAGSAVTGAFTNVASGQQITSDDGSARFFVYYGQSSPLDPTEVILTNYSAVPEPAGLALLGSIAGLTQRRKRRR